MLMQHKVTERIVLEYLVQPALVMKTFTVEDSISEMVSAVD